MHGAKIIKRNNVFTEYTKELVKVGLQIPGGIKKTSKLSRTPRLLEEKP